MSDTCEATEVLALEYFEFSLVSTTRLRASETPGSKMPYCSAPPPHPTASLSSRLMCLMGTIQGTTTIMFWEPQTFRFPLARRHCHLNCLHEQQNSRKALPLFLPDTFKLQALLPLLPKAIYPSATESAGFLGYLPSILQRIL